MVKMGSISLGYAQKICNIAVIQKVSGSIVFLAAVSVITCDGRVVKALDLKSNENEVLLATSALFWQIFNRYYVGGIQ